MSCNVINYQCPQEFLQDFLEQRFNSDPRQDFISVITKQLHAAVVGLDAVGA